MKRHLISGHWRQFPVRGQFWGCLLALGTSSVSVQFVLIREIMSSFGGNELVIGLVLGAWLLFTGLGSALGVPIAKKAKQHKILFWGHILIAIIPFFQVAATRGLPLLWMRGEMLGLDSAILSSSLILLPYCIVSGGMIPVAGALLPGGETTSRVYIADTIGDIAGGLLFSLVLVYTLSHWDSLIFLGILNLVAAAVMASRAGIPVLVIVVIGILAAQPLQTSTISWRFPGQALVLHKNTPFAQLTISKTGRQLNVLQDAIPLFSTNDLDVEAKAHLPLCQVEPGARVLLISGGVFGTIDEIAKHKPTRLDYVELDPAILGLDALISGSLSRPFVHSHTGDGRLFVKKASLKYDVVIVDLPDPENTQLNRFYSLEFFNEVRSILTPVGIFSFNLVGAENYLEEKGLAVNRSVFAALRKAFKNIVVFPGATHHYLASDGALTSSVSEVLAKRNIETKRLANYELPTMEDLFRMDLLANLLIEQEVEPNRDLSPTAFGNLLEMWIKKSDSSTTLLYVVFVLTTGFAAFVCRKDRIGFTVMTSGYAGMAFELSLLLLFQVIYGYVYLRICIFVTLFIIGSALGAFTSGRLGKAAHHQMIVTDLVLVATAVAASVAALYGVDWKGRISLFAMQYTVIPFLIFIVAFAAGCQFSAASRIARGTRTEITGRLYVADLAGAACGTILTGLFFLPRIGIVGVLASVGVLKCLSLGLNMRTWRRK